jgi:hypothetical protein
MDRFVVGDPLLSVLKLEDLPAECVGGSSSKKTSDYAYRSGNAEVRPCKQNRQMPELFEH